MPVRTLQLIAGLVMVAFGGYLTFSPLTVARVLGRAHETSSQMINLRATFGGTIMGLGLFIAWLPALQPWRRSGLGLVAALMAGIFAARLVGFTLDGHPDRLQWFWLIAEAVITIGCTIMLRR
jgi:hypothetical protein